MAMLIRRIDGRDVKKPAADIAAAIVNGQDDPRLQWLDDRSMVHVLVGQFIDASNAQTLAGSPE